MSKTRKRQIMKLYCTKEEMNHRCDESHDSLDDILNMEKEKPNKIIEKLLGKTEAIAAEDKLMSKLFTFEKTDILVIMNKDKAWYQAKQIADILKYANTRDALINHVDKKYKKNYSELMESISGVAKPDGTKAKGTKNTKIQVGEIDGKKLTENKKAKTRIPPNTIFITNAGLFQLVSRSKKEEALKLWQFITETILPELFAKGSFRLPITDNDIKKLTTSFYTENMLSDYENCPVVYLLYLGEYEKEHILKWGSSQNFARRELHEHRPNFKEYNVIKIWKTIAFKQVEDKIKINFLSKNMVKPMKIGKNGKTQVEIVSLDEINNFDYCINMINKVVDKTTIPEQQKYIQEISKLKSDHEFEILKMKYENLIEINKNLIEINNDLKEDKKRLRKTIDNLQNICGKK